MIRKSLEHRDKARAKSHALAQSSKLEVGDDAIRAGHATLGQVFDLYLEHRTPKKSLRAQKSDSARVTLWKRILGTSRDPHDIRLGEWEAFIEARRSGAIDARGNPVVAKDRRPVGDRTVHVDLEMLFSVFNWAKNWRPERGPYLMRENPVRGFDVPKEKNPKRPFATWDRYETIRGKTDEVMMEIRSEEKKRDARSYVSELLDLAVATGRRISAICALTYGDLRLTRTETAPHGGIHWPATTDKAGKAATVPLNALGRKAIDRILQERPALSGPLFPSPAKPSEPVSRHLADKWLRASETLAEVEPFNGGLWHPYRRMWATARKDLPAQDVARAGGWATVRMVEEVYTQADELTTLGVVLHEAKVREAR
jgi:integrase